jgi:hypothetical protein
MINDPLALRDQECQTENEDFLEEISKLEKELM